MRVYRPILCSVVLLLFAVPALGQGTDGIDDKGSEYELKPAAFSITGQITGLPEDMRLVLRNLTTDEILGTARVQEGTFQFRGALASEPEELRIISANEHLREGLLYYTDLLMGNEDVQLEGDVADLPHHINTSGSTTQAQASAFRQARDIRRVVVDSLRGVYGAFPDSIASPERTEARAAFEEAQAELEAWERRFVIDNFDSYIALLTNRYAKSISSDTLAVLYEGLSPEMKASPYGRVVGVQVQYPRLEAGDRVYDFVAMAEAGDMVRVGASQDTFTLLQFAGTSCFGSHRSMGALKALLAKYEGQVDVVSFFSEPREDWIGYSRTNNITWTAVGEDGGVYGDTFNKYWVTGTPTFYLISPEREVVATWFGYREGELERIIDQALADAVP